MDCEKEWIRTFLQLSILQCYCQNRSLLHSKSSFHEMEIKINNIIVVPHWSILIQLQTLKWTKICLNRHMVEIIIITYLFFKVVPTKDRRSSPLLNRKVLGTKIICNLRLMNRCLFLVTIWMPRQMLFVAITESFGIIKFRSAQFLLL